MTFLASVQSVDFFRSFVSDPYVFGKIAANHSLSDVHAMCADAKTALAIAVVPFAVEDKVHGCSFHVARHVGSSPDRLLKHVQSQSYN